MGKKVNYNKWNTAELEKQLKNLKFATGLLAGILIVLFGVTIYKSITEQRFHPLLVSPIALSAIIPINLKRMRNIRQEIDQRNAKGSNE